ncbi:hypothetical protein A374_03089 [Fictibacillus macauensis ZFHKF-1]|uniref:Uncharacterized protein n=1 Tax=Fictibacillus macauensis ZFHKF-1 TaxID=1196324 RepID=I8AKZ9_9BACL|nr:lasso peptide biosynthesis PqqD family chaperone [Fictibacillus macauensis]EIT86522.1 hypothetical protein A374_03089 [Fictibacillus macauensis ZFHKF-1]
MTLAIDVKVMQEAGYAVSDMAGEKVLLSIEKGKYYNLGETGGLLWELMSEPKSIEQIITEVMEEYAVERSVCEQEVLAFITNLQNENLIRVL